MNRKKVFNNQILLSVAALLVILMLGAGMTYSWIEGGTTLTMETEKGKLPSTQETLSDSLEYAGKIELDPATTKKISLVNNYDENTNLHQNLHFSPVSSCDGENFFFPIAYDENGDPTAYRRSNTNDIGTKFIKYKFNFKAIDDCYLAFASDDIITATKGADTNNKLDTSAFRVMISSTVKGVETPQIFSSVDKEADKHGVIDNNGSTLQYKVLPFKSKVYDTATKNRIFEYDKDEEGTIEVAIWLDSSEDIDDLFGSDIKLSLNLLVKRPMVTVKFDAVTVDNNNRTLDENERFKGGYLSLDNANFKAETLVQSYVEGGPISAYAKLKVGDFPGESYYKFDGWYSDKSCTSTSKVSSDLHLQGTAQPINGKEPVYYAKFIEKPVYNVSVHSVTVPDSSLNGGTVYVGSDKNTTTLAIHDKCSVNISASQSEGFAFKGWYKKSDLSDTPSGSTPLKVTVNGSDLVYYAKFLQKYTVTLKARTNGTVGNTGGNVQIDSTPETAAATAVKSDIEWGTSVTLKYTEKSGYDFKEFKTQDGEVVTSSYVVNKDVIIYADFITSAKKITTIYFEPRSGFTQYNSWVWNPANNNHYCGSTWPGEQVTEQEEGYYKCQFETTDKGKFQVIVSNNGSNQFPASGSAGLEGDIGGSYLFTADNKFIEFTIDDLITINASATTGGTATVGEKSSVKVRQGQQVNLVATAANGYAFDSWNKNGSNTTLSASQKITVDDAKGSTVNYQAKFVRTYLAKANAVLINSSTVTDAGGTVKVSTSSSAGSDSSSSQLTVRTGSSVTFTATNKPGYSFKGWYSSATGNDPVNSSSSFSTTVTAQTTYYARFEQQGTVVYLKPNANWKSDSAWFAARVWINGASDEIWYTMNKESDGTYSTVIAPGYEKIIFCRMNKASSATGWNNVWNQTNDLVIPSNGNNMYTVTEGAWSNGGGSWSKK